MIRDLTALVDMTEGEALPLPEDLARFYGPLRFRAANGQAQVLANFVTTLDGVVSWNVPGQMGGAQISGFSGEDTAIMGLLRAASDAVIVGAATQRAIPNHLWTPEHIQPALADAYHGLRAALGKTQPPLAVIVTGSGEVDTGLRVFVSGEEPALIVTTPAGERRLRAQGVPTGVNVAALAPGEDGKLNAASIVDAVAERLDSGPGRLLVEGGPQLMAAFFKDRALDELFLTLSPQVAGRDSERGAAGWRPGLVEGALLAPDAPAWGRLVSVKQQAHHLFVRYQF